MDYSKTISKILKKMSSRQREVIERRFGLFGFEKRETLEAIGKSHGITRERVRQIEKEAILSIDKEDIKDISIEINNVIRDSGGLKKEDILLSLLGKDKNNIFFFLSLNSDIKRNLENNSFHSFWIFKDKKSKEYLKVIKDTISLFQKEKKPLFIEELYNKLNPKEIILPVYQSYIEISKEIQKNPEGKIGLKGWIEINPRGIREKAYLVLKKTEKPLHFREIASLIKTSLFSGKKDVHTATVHNELIKNNNFVLVGRGLYALKEWGYEPGVVKDVISNVMSSGEALSKEEILERVLKKRVVKEHTIFLNLQDKKRFIKDKDGKYKVKEG